MKHRTLTKKFAIFSLIYISLGCCPIVASNPFTPVEKSDLNSFRLTHHEPLTLTPDDSSIGFELNFRFGQNTSVTVRLNESESITLHLSDKKVNHDLSDPFYLLEITSNGKVSSSYIFDRIGIPNNFAAIKLINGELFLGNRTLHKICDLKSDISKLTITAKGDATLCRTILFLPPWRPEIIQLTNPECEGPESPEMHGDSTMVTKYSNLWDLLDEDLDLSYSMLGGNYTLASLETGDTIKLIYLSGARIYSDLWKPGMIKGIATKTERGGAYDLYWIDAEFDDSVSRAYLTIDGNIMTMTFPYDNATIQFKRREKTVKKP